MSHFRKYAEPIPGESTNHISAIAKECGVYVVAGGCDRGVSGGVT